MRVLPPIKLSTIIAHLLPVGLTDISPTAAFLLLVLASPPDEQDEDEDKYGMSCPDSHPCRIPPNFGHTCVLSFLRLSLMLIAFFTSDRQLMPSPITCILADVSRNDVK